MQDLAPHSCIGFQNIAINLPYSKIAETIQVDASEVEKWVIDGEFHPGITLALLRLLTSYPHWLNVG